MKELLEKILQLAKKKKYEEIINLINNSEFRNDKKIFNIKKSVKKYCRMQRNSMHYLKKDSIEVSDNLWNSYFECMKSNSFLQAYEIIQEINSRLNNKYSNFYLILTLDLLKLNEENCINNQKIDHINSQILDLISNANYVSSINLEKLLLLLNKKVILKQTLNQNCYLEEHSLNIINVINQLKLMPYVSKDLFNKFDYSKINEENFYDSLEVGDYISSLKYLKMPEVFQSLKNSYDKTYPLLLFKLLKTLENICSKKIKSTDKYENLISSIENKNYLEALKINSNNKFENDYTIDIVNLLALKK